MSHLLDVNLLLACAWQSHVHHGEARSWLEKQRTFATCPITQLGFLRVSLSPGYRAAASDALAALEDITQRKAARFLAEGIPANRLPVIESHSDATDAYLITLAQHHKLKLATLDDALCGKPWAKGLAINPIRELGHRSST
jgi:hypothetical protein